MRKFFCGVFSTYSMVAFSGCAAQVKYQFDKDSFVSPESKKYAVAVDVFQDNRPEREKEGKLYGKEGYAVNNDKMFKKDIPRQVSRMLAEHLTKAKVFDKVQVEEVSDDLESKTDEMAGLKNKGYDLAVMGKLNHFYGYYSDEVSATTSAVLFGVVGMMVEAISNPKTVGGKVEYGDVRIIDLARGVVVWSGNVEHAFEKQEKFYDGPVGYVLKALKETNDKFSHQLSEGNL